MKFSLRALVAASLLGLFTHVQAEPVRIIHGINGTDLGLDESLPVDIRLGYRCIAKGVTFRTIAPDFNVRPGAHVLRVTLANERKPCWGKRVLTDIITVNFGDNLSIIAHETDDGTITTTKFIDDVRMTDPANGTVTVRHTADAPAVDILVNDAPALVGLSNGNGQKASLPGGAYSVAVAPAGSPDPVFGPVELTLPVGFNTVVYAVGSLANGTFEPIIDSIPLE